MDNSFRRSKSLGVFTIIAMIFLSAWLFMAFLKLGLRSFELNDEVNLAAFDGEMCRRLTEDFMSDLQSSHAVTYDEWKRRPLTERLTESFGSLIQRQQ